MKTNLQSLIIALAIGMALLTLLNSLLSSYKTQKNLLIDQTLEANYAYASKLAKSTDDFLGAAQQQMAYSANYIANKMDKKSVLDNETERLQKQTNSFNSVMVTREDGLVASASPQSLHIVGMSLNSPGVKDALRRRVPIISSQYLANTGRLVILVSHPIFSHNGKYMGYIGGTIYLHEKNILHTLLGEHYAKGGAYLYVVDSSRELIYHKDKKRIGQFVSGNPVIEQLIKGKEGSARLRNSKGVDMLSGYAPLHRVPWGVVAQRPTEAVLTQLNGLIFKTAIDTIPIFLFSVLCIWWLSRIISKPLSLLANTANSWDSPTAANEIAKIKAWYFEAELLKAAILLGLKKINVKLGVLSHDSITDPLTGLKNRRGMQMELSKLELDKQPLAIIAADIDHFKFVNDDFGHDTGDLILQLVSNILKLCTRNNDSVCRSGGEEFCIILPGCNLQKAAEIAEKIRLTVANSKNPTGRAITISLGVTQCRWGTESIDYSLKMADQALYTAKRNGRNRVDVIDVDTTKTDSAHLLRQV